MAKQKIARSDVVHMVNDWKSGNLNPFRHENPKKRNLVLWMENTSDRNLQIGSVVAVSSQSLGSLESAMCRYFDGDIVVGYKSGGSKRDPVGFCIDPINKNQVGRIIIPGVFGAMIAYDPDDDVVWGNFAKLKNPEDNNELTAPYLSCETSGEYRIIATSERDANILSDDWQVAFGLLYPLGTTVDVETGHLYGTLLSSMFGPNDLQYVRVTTGGSTIDYPVKCPLLASTQIIPIGTLVAIDVNLDTGDWEIISSFGHGHLRGVLSQQIQGPSESQAVGVYLGAGLVTPGVVANCPLLGSTQKIAANAIVILSWNIGLKRWEIIETPCAS